MMLLILPVAILAGLFLWGVLRLRKGRRQSVEAIRKLRVAEIPMLVTEGKEGLARGYAITVDLSERESAARTIDGLFEHRRKLKDTFAQAGAYWRFGLPIGALVGEYLRIHASGEWRDTTEGPAMELPIQGGTATCYPFDKVLKQVGTGAKGDMYAFLIASTRLSSIGGSV